MILQDFIQAIATAMGTTLANAGLVVSMVFILVLVIIALASKGKNDGFEGIFIVAFVGIILFTGIGWIDIIYGVAMAFFIALMGAVLVSKHIGVSGGD